MELLNTKIGKYTLTKYIGEGGMASVYEGTHLFLGTKAAVKVLNPMLSKNDQFRQRFRNEAAFMASLDHPNITKVLDFEDSDEVLAIVMELLEGSDLSDLVKEKGALTFEEFKPLFIQILDAFKYAHNQGIVHRDIKPSNIFIDARGTVKILDFGIAKLFGQGNEMTQTGTQMGTPAYMSPEQVKGDKSIDHRSDIYALGVTLFYAMEGRSPYDTDNESQFDIFNKIVFEELPVLTENSAHTFLIQKACQKDRNLRYQQIEEFENALNGEAESQPKVVLKTTVKTVEEKQVQNPIVAEKTIVEQPKTDNSVEQKGFFNLNRLLIGAVLATFSGVTLTKFYYLNLNLTLTIGSALFICSAAIQFFINNKIVLKITLGVFAFYWLIFSYYSGFFMDIDTIFMNPDGTYTYTPNGFMDYLVPLIMIVASILSILAQNKRAYIFYIISCLLLNINFLEFGLEAEVYSNKSLLLHGFLFFLYLSPAIIFFYSRKHFGLYSLVIIGLLNFVYVYFICFQSIGFGSFISLGDNMIMFLLLPLIELSSKLIGYKSTEN